MEIRFFLFQRRTTGVLRGDTLIFLCSLMVIFSSPLWGESVAANSIFVNFDCFPITGNSEIPESSAEWQYNSDMSYDQTGWERQTFYGLPNGTIYDRFYSTFNTYNSNHMGFSTYGYLEITKGIINNGLKYAVTGGKNTSSLPDGLGLKVTCKEEYLDYVSQDIDPVASSGAVGHPYLYFTNNSPRSTPVPFEASQGMNRLSFYVKMPASVNNGEGGYGAFPLDTISIGPYSHIPKDEFYPDGDPNEEVTGHWYHKTYTRGGGWIHVLVDGHPHHNNSLHNAGLYPYPSYSLRNMGNLYFNNMYRWYITFKPYEGIAVPPYEILLDEIEFLDDPEPQNCETICTPAVMYVPSGKVFEICFSDKYKNIKQSYSTYEVRYSFEPITNANWSGAFPVHIVEDQRFGIDAATDGRFEKAHPYSQHVWAPFTLASQADMARLTPGTRIYFAVKDVSQVGGSSQIPISATGGRDYETYPELFDYEGDASVLDLIKRIDYIIAAPDVAAMPLAPIYLLLLD